MHRFCLFALLAANLAALDFEAELRQESSRSGLAIGYIAGSGMLVLPLEGGPLLDVNLENHAGPCWFCPGWFSSDGNLITWEVVPLYQKPNEPSLIVTTITGEPMSAWVGPVRDIYAVALSPDRSKIAFEAWDVSSRPPNVPMGLQVVRLGGTDREVVDEQPPKSETDGSQSIGWSPDSRRLVYSRHGKIIVVDIDSRKQTEIASGTNPAWSPNGRWISFTSAVGTARLLELSTRREVGLWNGRKISGPIAWSPNSCCISFSAEGTGISSLLYPGGRMIVYRISDGAWFRFAGFSFGPGSSARFGWFYHYKAFIAYNNAHMANPAK